MTLDEIADAIIAWAVEEPRVRALWSEGPAQANLRRPYKSLELHLAADQPDYPGLLAEIQRNPTRLGIASLQLHGSSEVPRFARELVLALDSVRLTLVLEQSYLLAKRPRAYIVPFVDKWGHLPHVLDYSARGKTG